MGDDYLMDMPERPFESLPVAAYICDREGQILRYNRRAAELWGRAPRIDDPAERFCGSNRLYRLDGQPLSRLQSPMADVLRSGCAVRSSELIIERPDGSQRVVVVNIDVLRDAQGSITGGIGCLFDITERPWNQSNATERSQIEDSLRASEARYRSLFNSIDQGFCVIEVLFDEADQPIDYVFLEINQIFEARTGLHDAVGRRMRSLAPKHEQHWFDTYGRIALTGIPERFELRADALDRWYSVYAFRIDAPQLRRVAILFDDITERKQQQDQNQLLLREMNHRIKNLLTITASVVSLSARAANTSGELVAAIRGRLSALASAHELIRPDISIETPMNPGHTTLAALIREIFAPYVSLGEHDERFTIQGPEILIGGNAVTSFALVLHEFATNALKYGALQSMDGIVDVAWTIGQEKLQLTWREHGGPAVATAPEKEGFGSLLARRTIEGQLAGQLFRDWRPDGLTIRVLVPMAQLAK